MSNFVNESIRRITENRGVIDYNFTTTDDNQRNEKFNEIYNFVHNKIIDYLNKKSLGQNKFDVNCVFSLDENLYRDITSKKGKEIKHLKPLKIKYNYKGTSSAAKIELRYTDDLTGLIMEINIGIFDPKFKKTFFHEMQHYYQLSFENSNFHDSLMDEITISKSPINTPEVRQLMSYVYKLNPRKANAYREQVYSEVYAKVLYSSQKFLVKELQNEMINQFYINERDFKTFISENKNDEAIKKYIIALMINNFNKFTGPVHSYNLFSSDLYNNETVQKIQHEIPLQTDDFETITDVFLHYSQDILIDKNLTDKITETFFTRLDYYRLKAISRLRRIIEDAKIAAEKAKDENAYNRYYNPNLRDYLSFSNHTSTVIIELIVQDYNEPDKEYILKVSGTGTNHIFQKIYALSRLLERYCEFEFGFDYVFDDIYNFYVDNIMSPKTKK